MHCLIDYLGDGGQALVLRDSRNACPITHITCKYEANCEVDSGQPLYEADCQIDYEADGEVDQEADRPGGPKRGLYATTLIDIGEESRFPGSTLVFRNCRFHLEPEGCPRRPWITSPTGDTINSEGPGYNFPHIG
jgi:hypothetical protein